MMSESEANPLTIPKIVIVERKFLFPTHVFLLSLYVGFVTTSEN